MGFSTGSSSGGMNVNNPVVIDIPVAIGDKKYTGADILNGF